MKRVTDDVRWYFKATVIVLMIVSIAAVIGIVAGKYFHGVEIVYGYLRYRMFQ